MFVCYNRVTKMYYICFEPQTFKVTTTHQRWKAKVIHGTHSLAHILQKLRRQDPNWEAQDHKPI